MTEATGAGPTVKPPGITWVWSGALLGLAYAVPAAAVALHDVSKGAAFAVGMVPSAILGVPPVRKRRVVIAAMGLFVGLPTLAGSALANVPVLAVAAIFAFGVGAVALAERRPVLGTIALSLALPMTGVGLSYTDVGTAAGLAAIMAGGGLYACAVAMLWPDRPPPPRPRRVPPVPTRAYGFLVGATGASAAAIGFLLDLDHVGWACAASLLVIRPSAEMQELRGVGRIASVVLGAAAAVWFIRLDPPAVAYSLAFVLVVVAVAATHTSRWYITAAFTTFLVFVLLLYGDVAEAGSRFGERVGETVLGVGLACLFGLVVPRVLHLQTLQPAAAMPPDRPPAGP